jgi:hypothetical protein
MILEGIWRPGYEHHYLNVYAYRIRDPSVGYRLAVDEADIDR